jgi:ATP-binding cassette, subfamily B, bacterial
MRTVRRRNGGPSAWLMIRPYVRRVRGQAALLGALLLTITLLQVLNPQIVRLYIDRAVARGSISLLIWMAVAYIIIAIVVQVTQIWATYIGENFAWGITNSVRADLTEHCVGLDYQFHQDHTPGELIERVDGDVTTLANLLSTAFLVIVSNLLLVPTVFIAMFITEWRIGVVLLLYAVCAIGALTLMRRFSFEAWNRVRATSATLFGFLGERLTSAEDIRTAHSEGFVLGRLDLLSDQMRHNQVSARLRSSYTFVTMHGLYLFGYGGALALGATLYATHEASLGTVFLVSAYANFIYLPLNQVQTQTQQMQLALAGMRRIAELFAVRPAITDGPGITLPAGPLAVEMRNVSHRYGAEGPWAARDVSFALAPGEVLGVMGRTGSGKTTLARLLARMYDPTEGTVLLAGQRLTDAAVADLRGHIGVVTQDVQIFRGSVRDNVSLFDGDIEPERIIQVIEDLGLGDWLARLPSGIDTVLDSGPGSMSAGEAQLLAICRVFLRDPGLILLDEVSSKLDLETERLLENALSRLLAGRTGFVISHRVSTMNRADRILVMEDGQIAEIGAREELRKDERSRFSRLAIAARQGVAG